MPGWLASPLRPILRLLTATGWVTLGVGAVLTIAGLRWGHAETFLVGAALLTLVVVALVWMLRPADLEGDRSVVPFRMVETSDPADNAEARLKIRNLSSRRSPRIGVLDHIDGQPFRLNVPSIEPAGTAELAYPVPCQVRGRHRLGPMLIARTDPFRLVRVGSVIGNQSYYNVQPRTVDVVALPTGRVRDVEGAATPRTAGSGVTFHTLREYVPGDDLRHVHWRSSARTGTLLVRQHVQTSEPRMLVFVDCRRSSYDGPPQFDDACRIAASLLKAAARGANPVELLLSSGRASPVDSSGAGLDAALDCLTEAEMADRDESLVRLARMAQRHHTSASTAVITGGEGTHEPMILQRLRTSFASFVAVQVGRPGGVQPLPLPVSSLLLVTDLDDFALRWRERVGR